MKILVECDCGKTINFEQNLTTSVVPYANFMFERELNLNGMEVWKDYKTDIKARPSDFLIEELKTKGKTKKAIENLLKEDARFLVDVTEQIQYLTINCEDCNKKIRLHFSIEY